MQGNSILSCDGTVFKSNMASGKGGAIYVEGSSTVTIAGASSFDGNAAASGGAIVFSTGV
jgi:predicted outer membrane repeat protein